MRHATDQTNSGSKSGAGYSGRRRIVPVISCSTLTMYETGETGIFAVFDADETAQDIIGLADDPAY